MFVLNAFPNKHAVLFYRKTAVCQPPFVFFRHKLTAECRDDKKTGWDMYVPARVNVHYSFDFLSQSGTGSGKIGLPVMKPDRLSTKNGPQIKMTCGP